MQKKITIIGATGHLGHRVASILAKKGTEVTAIVRDPARARSQLPDTIELVQGDVSDPSSLHSALSGTETLYISLNTESLDPGLPFHTEREGVFNIVAAARENGVRHMMQIAGIDFLHPEFAANGMTYQTNEIRKDGISAIKRSGIPYTFFYCSFFLDSFPKFLQDKQLAVIGNHVHPIFFTNTGDLADMVYNAIGNEAAWNRDFAVQGLDSLSYPEAAKEFLRHYDADAEVIALPLETIRHMGLPDDQAAFAEHMLTYVEQLKEQQVSAETWSILGKPNRSIETFVHELIEQS